MMSNEKVKKILTCILTPLSWLYGMVTSARNWMFDNHILKEEEFPIPVISVGNITVGGTGKTPHTEYIVRMLSSEYSIAVLSRGYKRKTRGFLMANSNSTPESIGDEPLQIYHKFGSRIRVAVCENRRQGIRKLIEECPDLQLIVLDDAFQHRYVKPKVSVLLMDYSRPFYEDSLLPLGRLRESPRQVDRADMVIVTKCPDNLTPLNYRLVHNHLELMPFQKLYFSRFTAGELKPVFIDERGYTPSLSEFTADDSVLLISGIANPRSFVRTFKNYPFRKKIWHFPDHHNFNRNDLEQLVAKFDALPGRRKIIITTEKDAVRLAYNPYFPQKLKRSIYYLPISVQMINGLNESEFIQDLKRAVERTDGRPKSQAEQ